MESCFGAKKMGEFSLKIRVIQEIILQHCQPKISLPDKQTKYKTINFPLKFSKQNPIISTKRNPLKFK
jgi:hypothetical protein